MREVRFLGKNAAKWKEFESLVKDGERNNDPNRLCDLFVEVTDDLSYAQTFYPQSSTTSYLNAMSAEVHRRLYRNKSERLSRLWQFWVVDYPLAIRRAHRMLLLSLSIVLFFTGIGVLSVNYDERFARLVLGDGYVNTTEENIKSGDAMGIYKSGDGMDMFMRIALNNVMVALRTFVFGATLGLGTLYVLFQNGVMLGVFQTMFFKYGVATESVRGIWLHGTLEISGLIVEGAAGLLVGASILFPKSYTRRESFRRGATEGMRLMIGLFPQIIAAAILESFVTRFSNILPGLSWVIICLSLMFVVWYYIVYPIAVEKGMTTAKDSVVQAAEVSGL